MIFSKANLFKLKKALLSLEEVTTEEGIVLITDDETLEVGMEVFVDGTDGLEPAKDGEYTVKGNIVTVEGGKIISIVEKPIEQPTEEIPTEETPMEQVETVEEQPMEEQPVETVETVETIEGPTVDELNAIIEEQKSVIEGLKSEIETIKAENEELKKKLEEPAAQSAEEDFKNQKPTVKEEKKIDFSKYIKRNK